MDSDNEDIKNIYFSNTNNNNAVVFFNNVETNKNNENEVILNKDSEDENQEDIEQFIFNNKNVIIEEDVYIQEQDRIYSDDIIYLQEIQNQLLSSYPVTRQSDKYIQEICEKTSQDIINAKNLGIKRYNIIENNIKYNLVLDYINNHFYSNWVIPIVMDKHKIFSHLKKDDSDDFINENKSDYFFSDSLEDEKGIQPENQISQFILLKNIFHEGALGKINYKNLQRDYAEIANPYVSKYESNSSQLNVGYITTPEESCNVLRFYDLDTINWNSHIASNEITTPSDIIDENRKIKGIKQSKFIDGDDINIVGFMILPFYEKMQKEYIEVGIATNIYPKDNRIIVECKNHGLEENDKIFIENSNSIPNINNVYQKSVSIIDKNLFSINISQKLIKNGSYARILKINKLYFDLYKMTKEDIDYKSAFLKSTYINKTESTRHNKVYIFSDINIENKDELKNIINTIVPSIDDILHFENKNLLQCRTFNDVNRILAKYYLKIDDLDLEQVNYIKSIFLDNLKKVIENKIDIKTNKKKINKFTYNFKHKNIDVDFLSNEIITNKEITQYYGEYPHLNKPEDNIMLRLKWVNGQKDNGELYFLQIIGKKYMENKSSINKLIGQKVIQYDKLLKDIDKSFLDDVKKANKTVGKKTGDDKNQNIFIYQPYVVTQDDVDQKFESMKKYLKDKSTIFLNGKVYLWEGGKEKELNDIKLNTFALVNDELWKWDGESWIKTDIEPAYDDINYISIFENLDLSKISYEEFKKIEALKSKHEAEILFYFQEISDKMNIYEKYLKNNEYIEIIKKRSEIIIKKYFSSGTFVLQSENDDKNINNFYVKKEKDELDYLLSHIYRIENDYLKQNLFFELLDKDGIVIDKNVYSKKFKRGMNICGHHMYLKNAAYANEVDSINKILTSMLGIYSDNGATEKNIHCCVNCGEFLLNNDFDDTEGFNDKGMLVKSRVIWSDKDIDIETDEKNLYNLSLLYEGDSNTNLCQDKRFREVLLNSGLSIDLIDEATNVCSFITNNLYSKSGVKLLNHQLINIIIDSIQKINEIPSFQIFKFKEIKKYQEKGFSKGDIEKFEERGVFKISYDTYKKIKTSSIITARFLIGVQTSLETIKRSSKSSVCAFTSFDGNHGIEFMACILKEMQIVLIKDIDKTIDTYKKYLEESYSDFKKMVSIRELFKTKYLHDKNLAKKIDDFKQTFAEENGLLLIEHTPLNPDFPKEVKKCKKSSEINDLKRAYNNRRLYLVKKIKSIISSVIAKSDLSDPIFGLPEMACCMESSEDYFNYYKYIQLNSDENIMTYIDELNNLDNYKPLFLQSGDYHRLYFKDPYKDMAIINKFAIDNETTTSESIIMDMFETFVSTGPKAGTKREYITKGATKFDLISGYTKSEILSKKYTIDEYRKLLDDIEKNNITLPQPDKNPSIDDTIKLLMNKKESEIKLDNEIKLLIRNISNILKKGKDFEGKYIHLFRNLGNFTYLVKEGSNSANKKQSIKNKFLVEKNRLDYLKKVYIQYLRKYLSIIKNGLSKDKEEQNLSFAQDFVVKEMQIAIYEHYQKFEKFINDDIRKYFKNINLDFSNKYINSIIGKDSSYTFDYEKVKFYSDFNFNDASIFLLFIIVRQMNKMFSCNVLKENDENKLIEDTSNNEEDDLILNMDLQRKECKYIAEFILCIMEMMEDDFEIFEVCKNQSEKVKNIYIHDIIETKAKYILQDDDEGFFAKQLQMISGKVIQQVNEADQKIEEEQVDINMSLEKDEEINFLVEQEKDKYINQFGVAPSEQYLEDYKQKQFEAMNGNGDNEDMMDDGPKGEDVIDQGANYGGFADYDFETGDGFDYAPEQE